MVRWPIAGIFVSRWGGEMSGDSSQDTVEQRSQRHSIVPLGGPQIAADGTLRCRFEMKYQISESKAAAVEHFIQPYLSPDRYCKLQPTELPDCQLVSRFA